MAFRMNRPIIKGTANHKASVAKATQQSIVSQARTTGDAGLIAASNALGKSYVPKAIDFELDKVNIDIPEKKEKKEKQPKVKKEKEPRVKKEKEPKAKRKSYWEKMREKRSLQKTKAAEERLRKRLEKAEQGEDAGDFSQIESEPSRETKKTEKYKSPEASTKEGEELLSRTKAGRNKALQDAAKKYNVKVEDLEAKEVGGKREFFPKQSAVGGSYGDEGGGAGSGGTQWDDELGRFRIPSGGISDEKYDNLSDDDKKVYDAEMTRRDVDMKAEMEALRPKQDNIKTEDLGDLPSMVNSGDIALDPVTNQYEYTDQYIKRNQPKVVKPVVEEKKTTTTTEKPKMSDFRIKKNAFGGTLTAKDQYEKAIKKWHQAQQEKKGKSPATMRDNRIYRNAIKGGVVQQNMIKSGYKPE